MQQENSPTKQRILEEALTLFSVRGYESVTVAMIADAVGIKAPSLYKHYKSKHDIFDAILKEMELRYERQTAAIQISGTDPGKDQTLFLGIDEDKLVELGRSLFLCFLHDEFMCKFRKMLTVEQFGNKELAALYTRQYVDEPISYQGMLFGLLSQSNIMLPENTQIMALHFYAPIFLLLTLCDRHSDREEEALQLIEQHIRQFNRLYRKET